MLSPRTFGSLLALATLGCLSALSASAQTVYSTYPVTGKSGFPYQISADGGYQGEHEIAMQFSLAQTSLIASAQLALYYDPSIVSAGAPYTGGPITVRIYSDTLGSPTTILAVGTIGAIATGGGISDYTATFTAPVSLTGGTAYWLSADGQNGSNATAFWALGTGSANIADRFDAAFNTHFTTNTDTVAAFSLNGSAATPEPGSFAMIGSCGLAGLGLLHRRQASRSLRTASSLD